jgi:biotin transport system ATP-binding protein
LGIVLSSVTLSRAGSVLFRDLSLSLTERRIGLIGDNGSGKTSLLRLVAGLHPPEQGSVRVHGLDTRADRRQLPGMVGLLFQNPDDQIIFPTVLEELAFSLTALGADRRSARERAEMFLAAEGLPSWGNRAVSTLSQGQRQRLCLMALDIASPRVLLLDEPFASLDLPTQAALMRRIRRADRQILFSTHQLAFVEEFERVLWLDQGRVRADGPGGAVCAAYRADIAAKGADAEPFS